MVIFLSITICCPLIHLCANFSRFLVFLFGYMSYTKLFWILTTVGTHTKYLLFPVVTDNTLLKPISNNLLYVNQRCSATQSGGQLSCHGCFDSLVGFITANNCSFVSGAMTLSLSYLFWLRVSIWACSHPCLRDFFRSFHVWSWLLKRHSRMHAGDWIEILSLFSVYKNRLIYCKCGLCCCWSHRFPFCLY